MTPALQVWCSQRPEGALVLVALCGPCASRDHASGAAVERLTSPALVAEVLERLGARSCYRCARGQPLRLVAGGAR